MLRFITPTLHSYLDYPVAAVLMAAPFILQLGDSSDAAIWVSVAAGVAALLLTLVTDHRTGVFRIVPFGLHLVADFLVAVIFVVAPFVFGFDGIDAWYYWVLGATVLVVVALARPEPEPS